MQLCRPYFALAPQRFGRGRRWLLIAPERAAPFRLNDDFKLFATTFVGGFLFMSLLLA